MRKITVVLLLLTIQTFSHACPDAMLLETFSYQDSLHRSYEIRFGVLHQLMMVQATVNHKTGYLCIDTGIKGLVLNEQLFDGIRQNVGIVNSKGDIIPSQSVFAHVELGCLTRSFPNARTANLHHIFNNDNNLVLGMIGWEIFDNKEILIDYLNAKIILFNLDIEGHRIEISDQFNSIAKSSSLHFVGQFPCIIAEVGNKKLNLILDSGATSNVICQSLYHKFKSNNVPVKKVQIRHLGGTSADLSLTKFAGLQIGHITTLPMKTLWYSLAPLNLRNGGSEIHGIIGQELFKQYQVGINFRKNEVTLYSYEKDLVRSDF